MAPRLPPTNRQRELMKKARNTASFDPRQLTYQLYDGESNVKRRESILSRIELRLGESDTTLLPREYGESSRTALYHESLRVGATIFQDEIQHKHGLFDWNTHHHTLINVSPLGLHPIMFIPTLKLQATPEQLAYWLPLAESGEIIGTYCQTELGHGTFVRGLETTATFDRETDEFIIHSPTLTSTKYWPGGVGYSSSHAIVMARLIIDGKDYGVHPFLTRIRSLKDFRPLPGIELGDIGITMGLKGTDNGYAVFNQVRIPRSHMLMRNAHVSRDGTFIKGPNDKGTYMTMVHTRNAICTVVAFQLAQAATIATRYSSIREQGNLEFSPSSRDEKTIMSFKSQHYRLLVIMSQAYALVFTSKKCDEVYRDLVSRLTRGDQNTLAYSHATLASLKAYATQVASDGAEDARRSCGGHGYSTLSGLPGIVADITSTVTLEGENYVMYQQAARYLVKSARSVHLGGTVDPPLSYLVRGHQERASGSDKCCRAQGDEFLDPSVQLSIFRHRAVRMIFECRDLLDSAGPTPEDAWNTHMMDLIAAARAHIEYFVLESFVEAVSRATDVAVQKVLKHLCDLFALTSIESRSSLGSLGFFEDAYISSSQLREIRAHVNEILEKLLPEAVGLTDAWNFSDASLQSALGHKDGNVYETLMSWTRQLPLNQANAKSGGVDLLGFGRYIRPIIHAKL